MHLYCLRAGSKSSLGVGRAGPRSSLCQAVALMQVVAFEPASPRATRVLGLAIGKRFCQMMGGDITVESEPGRGSTLQSECHEL